MKENLRMIAGLACVLVMLTGAQAQAQERMYPNKVKTVRAPDVVSPGEVERMQVRLSEILDTPTRLVVRTVLAKDVAATGSTMAVTKPDLNGVFFSSQISGRRAQMKLAEQVLIEQLGDEPGLELVNVMYGDWHDRGLVVAGVESIRAFTREEIRRMETALGERLEDPDLRLVVRAMPSDLVDRRGRIMIGWNNLDEATKEEMAELPQWERVICDRVRMTDGVLPLGVAFNVKDGKWRALVEVVGPRNVNPGNVAKMQAVISRKLKRPMEINLWYRTDYVVTKSHLESYEEFTEATLEERVRTLPVLFQ